MGILRLMLAICVLAEHARGTIFGIRPLPGYLAVQAFYVLSGFYMALVLSEKYVGANSLGRFYRARATRIFPMYWIVLLATLVMNVVAGWPGDPDSQPHSIWSTLPNVTLFGLDWGRIAGLHAVVPQAWTLGVELTFYVVAPLLIRANTWFLLAIIGASCVGRAAGYSVGLTTSAWTNGFFPFELALFLAGMVSYRAYRAISQDVNAALLSIVGWMSLSALTIVAIFVLPMNPPVPDGWGPARNWGYLVAVVVALPFIFSASRYSRTDDLIGQFSYPIYITHFVVLRCLEFAIPGSLLDQLDFGLLVAGGSILICCALLLWLEHKPKQRQWSPLS